MKEKATQMYSTVAYLLAKFTADLPINILLSFTSSTLVYVRWIIIDQFLSCFCYVMLWIAHCALL
jgi:hypothetical protein